MPKAFLVRKGRQHITAPGTGDTLPFSVNPLIEAGLLLPGPPYSGSATFPMETSNLHASYINMVMQYRRAMRDYPELYRETPTPIDLSTSDLSSSELPPTPCYTPDSDYSSGE